MPAVPSYVYEAIASYKNTDFTVLRRARPRAGSAPPLICVLRNEIARLPDFLRHYRDGGIENFIFIDNGSDDGSVEFLMEQPDATLYQIHAPFRWQRKQGWIQLAIALTGIGPHAWYLYADADEHIVFSGYGDEGFGDFAARMSAKGYHRIRGVLIDMYGERALLDPTSEPASEAFPYFDAGGYVEAQYPQIISRKGGPRQRAFGRVDPNFRPELTKYPLFQLRGRDTFANPHHIWPYEGNFDSPCLLGILHYKFTGDFQERVRQAIENKSYWDGSLEYRCYDAVLRENPRLSLMHEGSRRYRSPADLVRAGIIEAV